jgi:undecaprenyl-diphosphatase
MTVTALPVFWQRLDQAEQVLCLRVNRGCRRRGVRSFFGAVSRVGDGPLWYGLMIAVALFDRANGWHIALLMAMTSAIGAALYKLLKTRLVRERPFISHAGILCGTTPLDRYSFPSGHTLHAVSFTTLAVHDFPELGWLLVPFAALIAASRVVLGLHYPSDVAAGALIGAALATLSMVLVPLVG